MRPPESREVVAARFLRGEEGLEFLKRPRIVIHTPDYYLWGLLESREYPLCTKRRTFSLFNLHIVSHQVSRGQKKRKLEGYKRQGKRFIPPMK